MNWREYLRGVYTPHGEQAGTLTMDKKLLRRLPKQEQALIAELIDNLLLQGAKSTAEIARYVNKTVGMNIVTKSIVMSRKARYSQDGRAPFRALPRSWKGAHKQIFDECAPTMRADEVHDRMLAHERASGVTAPPFSAVLCAHGKFRMWLAAREGRFLRTKQAAVTPVTSSAYARALRHLNDCERPFVHVLCDGPQCTAQVKRQGDLCPRCKVRSHPHTLVA